MTSRYKKPIRVYENKNFLKLVTTIGIENTRKLIARFPGEVISIPKINIFLECQRNILITRDYLLGIYSRKEMGVKWGLHPSSIDRIVKTTLANEMLKKCL